jgi:hypothetical protein
MHAFRGFRAILAVFAVAGSSHAEIITWFSPGGGKTNLTSSGVPMTGSFRFELGVFSGSFVPTAANKQDWAANWNCAQRTPYNPDSKLFSDSFDVIDNGGQFAIGKQAYVWGFNGDATAGEWILFRHVDWDWPVATDPGGGPGGPPLDGWSVVDATAIVGAIDPDGSPFLMQSAAVTNAAPPTTTWSQWQTENLTGEALDQPGDDPDKDGSSNLLEYVFGTLPKSPNPPVATPVSLVSGHAVITIPRRIDHPALLVVEVSGDLVNWSSGPSHTEVQANGLHSLVVRDLTPLDPAHPKRFLRLKASLFPP